MICLPLFPSLSLSLSVSLPLSLFFSVYTSHAAVLVSRNQRLRSLLIDLIPLLLSFSLIFCLSLFSLSLSLSLSFSLCLSRSVPASWIMPGSPSSERLPGQKRCEADKFINHRPTNPTHDRPTDPTHRPTDRPDRIQPINLTTLSTVHYWSTATSRALTPSPAFTATLALIHPLYVASSRRSFLASLSPILPLLSFSFLSPLSPYLFFSRSPLSSIVRAVKRTPSTPHINTRARAHTYTGVWYSRLLLRTTSAHARAFTGHRRKEKETRSTRCAMKRVHAH